MTKTSNKEKEISPKIVEDSGEQEGACTICHVRLRPGSPPVTYAVKDLHLKEGEWVVVPTDHGPEIGQVTRHPVTLPLVQGHIPPFVTRLATTSEIEDYYKNLEMEDYGRRVCQRLIGALDLKMKLVKVERFFDGSKIIFYYSADGRIDFRELVKRLVRELRIRVEMRQIGIRHEAKLIGGIGCCGRELCCASFLSGFDPISIKMAKAQNLPLNPNKISGFCGRLLCCLTYEYETYKEMAQDLPGLGKACETPDGQGKVVRHNIFRQAVTVAMPDGTFVEYTMDQLDGSSDETGDLGQREMERPMDQKSSSNPSNQGPDGKKRQGKRQQRRPKAQGPKPSSKKEKKEGKTAPGEAEKNHVGRPRKNQRSKKNKKRGGKKRGHNRKRAGKKIQKKKDDAKKS